MLANKLNYGDTLGVVGVANSLELGNRYDDFTRAEELLENKGFKIKRAKNVLEDYYGSAGTREQKAEGKIIGTNLGSMMYLLGTEYLAEMQDNILFIESYRTSLNECQRRFAHLKQFGLFDKVNGIVIGYNYDLQKNGDVYPQMEDILKEYTKEYDFPIIKCNNFGHKIANIIIPIGVNVKVDDNKINILEEFLN